MTLSLPPALYDLWKSPCLSVPQFPYLCPKDMEDLSLLAWTGTVMPEHVTSCLALSGVLATVKKPAHRQENDKAQAGESSRL